MDIRSSFEEIDLKIFGAKAAFFIFVSYVFAQLFTSLFIRIISLAYMQLTGYSESQIIDVRMVITITFGTLVSFFVVVELIKPYFPSLIRTGAFESLGWIRCSWKWNYLALALGVILALLYVYTITPVFPPNGDYVSGPINTVFQLGGWFELSIIVLIVFLAPICEEFVYRGVLYSGFARSFGKYVSALIVIFLFTVMHIGEFGSYWVPLSAISCLAILTLLIRELSGSLLPAVILHSAYNLTQVVSVHFS